ncbi:hypothetical protein CMV_024015 [Castanea mollissima]|uniref:Uncharacterized protein n=1 Tax=Castanea mollissima TaxID=60419 RepID=A0A8J4QHT9_9ROSI|nr:hypothetical protein CMV_024015 [Castanea mollissima]
MFPRRPEQSTCQNGGGEKLLNLGPKLKQPETQDVVFFTETLRHLSAKHYPMPMVPPPRSTIAAAFSPDGRTLVSTRL